VLANRLAPILPQMVGVHQSAFVRGRCLHDNFMMVQGTARKLHSRLTPAVLLKLDITKAFDTVEWPFLIEVLRILGFGERFLSCICALMSMASTRVLLNGCPRSRIANRRGLRQGDPLSPQLFILIMEVLHLTIEKDSAVGLLTPLAPSGLRHRTSIYADTWSPSYAPWRLISRSSQRSSRTLGMPRAFAPTWLSARRISLDALTQTRRSWFGNCAIQWSPSLFDTLDFP
jgi:hypothetical protein